VIAVGVVELATAGILVTTGWSVPARTAPILLLAGALLMVLAAATSLDDPGRATALGIGTSSALALAIGPSGNEALIGGAGMGLAALALGSRFVVGRGRQEPVAEPAAHR